MRFFLTSCLLLLISLPGFADPLRVMSYNIRYNNPNDGENIWENRKENVAAMIAEIHKADIAGLQEVVHVQLLDLISLLPDTYSYVGVGRGDGDRSSEYTCIFYRNDMYELIATNTFWLSATPEVPGIVSWDSALTRIATWAKFKEKDTGKEFFFFNTHFDHRGEMARTESAKLIVNKVYEIAGNSPTILTGDFNAQESSLPYAVLTGKEPANHLISDFKDGRYVSKSGNEGPTATFNNWYELREEETKIDFIFVRKGFEVLSHKVLDDKFDNRFPSDHLPVFAEIEFEE